MNLTGQTFHYHGRTAGSRQQKTLRRVTQGRIWGTPVQDLAASAPRGLCTTFLFAWSFAASAPAQHLALSAVQAAPALAVHSAPAFAVPAALSLAQHFSPPAYAPNVNAATVIARMIFFMVRLV